MSRQDRLLEVYEYVRTNFPIHTKNDFAAKLNYHRTYLSAAMHGSERNLTDNLFKTICEKFPGVFDLDYLLTGIGNLLANPVAEQRQDKEPERHLDQSSLINSAIAARDEVIAAKDETIAAKNEQISDLRKQLADKDVIIASLQAQLHSKSKEIVISHPIIGQYPHPIGAAEQLEISSSK